MVLCVSLRWGASETTSESQELTLTLPGSVYEVWLVYIISVIFVEHTDI